MSWLPQLNLGSMRKAPKLCRNRPCVLVASSQVPNEFAEPLILPLIRFNCVRIEPPCQAVDRKPVVEVVRSGRGDSAAARAVTSRASTSCPPTVQCAAGDHCAPSVAVEPPSVAKL